MWHRSKSQDVKSAGALLRPGRGSGECDECACMLCVSICLSVREHISGTTGQNVTKFSLCMHDRGSVLL